MHMGLRLAPLFLGILAGLTGCPFFYAGCGDPYTETHTVDPTALAKAQEDGALSLEECSMLCNGTAGATTGGEPTTSAGGSSSGDASTGGSSSGGSTGGGSTSGSTGGGSTTGTFFDGTGLVSCSAIDGEASSVSCKYDPECIGGRRPAGLRSSSPCRADAIGSWFASAAHLEAASVPAFERLRDELRAFGAPEALVVAAERAADDERRHAAAMRTAAELRGAEVTAPEVAAAEPRSLLALALENAVEGCVKETWAALLAAHQAERAEDPEVRAMMAEIAADETRHAELAWAIDAWVRTRLDAAELAAIADARRAAAAGLRPCDEAPEGWIRALGLPSRAREEAMWRALSGALWAA